MSFCLSTPTALSSCQVDLDNEINVLEQMLVSNLDVESSDDESDDDDDEGMCFACM